ncbi:hypothetical protein NSS70_10690 [Aeribacillus sp. FSL K6-2848]|uniref:hypothetical protein n=1 Tax=Aeribacillus sp. FSL K6-2848 TaxID=2954612 RepID=UPI0030FC4C66
MLEMEKREVVFKVETAEVFGGGDYFFADMFSGHCAKNSSNPGKTPLKKDHSQLRHLLQIEGCLGTGKCAASKKTGSITN